MMFISKTSISSHTAVSVSGSVLPAMASVAWALKATVAAPTMAECKTTERIVSTLGMPATTARAPGQAAVPRNVP